MKRAEFLAFAAIIVCVLFYAGDAFAFVKEESGKTYIVDRTGEKWDITQAVSIGFDPRGFQYGIGRNAFITLDDSSLSDSASDVDSSLRILGISGTSDAKAYSTPKLSRHEIANSSIGSTPVAAAY